MYRLLLTVLLCRSSRLCLVLPWSRARGRVGSDSLLLLKDAQCNQHFA